MMFPSWSCSAAAILILIAPGCGESGRSADEISEDEYDDVARSIGGSTATTSGDTGAMTDAVLIAGGDMPLGLARGADGHVTGSVDGIEFDYVITCHNISGTVQQHCDASTDRADVELAWSGELDLPNLYSAVAREGRWSLGDLQTTVATLSGEGAFAYDASITNQANGRTFDYALDYAATYDEVLIDTASRTAIGGNIHHAIAAQKWVDGETIRSFSIAADIYVHNDGTATIVLDDRHEYTLQLDTGVTVRVGR
jgi:hypothetical protein